MRLANLCSAPPHGDSKAKSARGHLRSLINKFGIPPASARNVQMVVVQSTLFCGAELWRDGNPRTTQPFQLAINRLARFTLGCFRSSHLGPLLVEANMTPAIPLLNYGRTRYAQRLRMPSGPRQILSISSNFTNHLNDAILLPHGLDLIEPVHQPPGMTFPGLLLPELNLEDELAMALAWTEVGDIFGLMGHVWKTEMWDAELYGRKMEVVGKA
ncbi:hypothetical protein FPQ18DRAFT_375577 [Pyronema domesticum]|nr:hypothetical protein FPQ18DRAFT_375577 [Pyronema domesticum]